MTISVIRANGFSPMVLPASANPSSPAIFTTGEKTFVDAINGGSGAAVSVTVIDGRGHHIQWKDGGTDALACTDSFADNGANTRVWASGVTSFSETLPTQIPYTLNCDQFSANAANPVGGLYTPQRWKVGGPTVLSLVYDNLLGDGLGPTFVTGDPVATSYPLYFYGTAIGLTTSSGPIRLEPQIGQSVLVSSDLSATGRISDAGNLTNVGIITAQNDKSFSQTVFLKITAGQTTSGAATSTSYNPPVNHAAHIGGTFSAVDRTANLARVGDIAKGLMKHGVVTTAPTVNHVGDSSGTFTTTLVLVWGIDGSGNLTLQATITAAYANDIELQVNLSYDEN